MTIRFNFLTVLLAFTVSTLPATICAAQTTNEPVTIISHVDIIPDAYKPLSEENAARLFHSEATATKHDAGLISFALLQENGLARGSKPIWPAKTFSRPCRSSNP